MYNVSNLIVYSPVRFIEVASVRVVVSAEFSGLRHLLHRHPWLCAIVATSVNMAVLAAILAALYFRRQVLFNAVTCSSLT